jgi:SAM-dependent methyltransferase
MRHMRNVPWQVKIASKIVLARMPVPYRVWEKIGLFKQGKMDRPEYAMEIFHRHFDNAPFGRRETGDFVALELGPGDSLCSALIVKAFGGARTYLVDAEACATADVSVYLRMEEHLRGLGLNPPKLDQCKTTKEVAAAIGAEYMTEGLASLRKIPSASVDFMWSHAVLSFVRRHDFLPILKEMRRIQRPDGVSSHTIPIKDIVGGKLNDLRFSEKTWESPLMANSRFYTNRLRYFELLELFRQEGFAPHVVKELRWEKLPTPRKKMAKQFSGLRDEDLLVHDFDVQLR